MQKLILIDFDKREVRFIDPELIKPPELHPDEHPWAQYCKSHRHSYHNFVPWMWKKPYDRHCDICDLPAAWVAGNNIALCDCHSEDWSLWNNKDGRLRGTNRNLKNIWLDCYRDFKKVVLSGEFVPDVRKEVAHSSPA